MKLKTLKDIQKHEIPGYGKASCIFISKLEGMIKDYIEYLKQPTEEYEGEPGAPTFREIHDIQIECLQHLFNIEDVTKLKSIAFSHRYLKLQNIDIAEPVTLIQVFPMHILELSDEFINYDTLHFSDFGLTSSPLLEVDEKILVLIFEQDGKVFTTIRNATKRNIDNFMTSIGCTFKIEYL